LTRRAKQEQDGIIAIIASVHALPVKGGSTRLRVSLSSTSENSQPPHSKRVIGFAHREAARACAGKGHIA
jgi:hypothetical protein